MEYKTKCWGDLVSSGAELLLEDEMKDLQLPVLGSWSVVVELRHVKHVSEGVVLATLVDEGGKYDEVPLDTEGIVLVPWSAWDREEGHARKCELFCSLDELAGLACGLDPILSEATRSEIARRLEEIASNPPVYQREVFEARTFSLHRDLNVHVTHGPCETVGTTTDAPGHYSACRNCNSHDATVAPGGFVEWWLRRELISPESGLAQAVAAWAQTKEGQRAPTYRCRCPSPPGDEE